MHRSHRITTIVALALILALFPASGISSLEREIVLGREKAFSWLDLIHLEGLSRISGRWDSQDLVLEDAEYIQDEDTDLLVHFNAYPFRDVVGNYRIEQNSPMASSKTYILGGGSAAFHSGQNSLTLIPLKESLFHSGWQDFSIEFWLYSVNMADGEEVLSWRSALFRDSSTLSQTIRCRFIDRKFSWEFKNFFISQEQTDFFVSGVTPLLPRTWYHHLLRFDSATGMLEYTVNGIPEGIIYITDSKEDGGSVLMPSTSTQGQLSVGKSLTGLVDELRITRKFIKTPNLRRYRNLEGVAISGVFDLEYSGSRLRSIEATYETPADTEAYFFYRIANELKSYRELDAPWIQFKPSGPLPQPVKGRYLQLRVELLPDGKGMDTPKISEIVVKYEPDLPPMPPGKIIATAGNGSVTLMWQRVNEKDVRGYQIYYGSVPGHYSGSESAEGVSPIDVGDETSFTLTGLENGKIYYFAVVSYDSLVPPHQSRFSSEVSARPSGILP